MPDRLGSMLSYITRTFTDVVTLSLVLVTLTDVIGLRRPLVDVPLACTVRQASLLRGRHAVGSCHLLRL